MDTRTRAREGDAFGGARDDREFAAITWRNLATALTRGFHIYWMDCASDWFSAKAIHRVIGRQVRVIKESVKWPHETAPGIAMILDDSSALETNGSGNFLNEAVMWEQKMGLARCGVPFRIYLFEDLSLDNFPEHRVYYFPNLFKVDDARLKLLQQKVFRNGHVVVWGPGSGISNGSTISSIHAKRLTGFKFCMLGVNYPRRTIISNFEHPITKNLKPDCIIGNPLPYGPILFPLDGTPLGLAWTKQGQTRIGLAIKEFGRGAASRSKDAPLGPGDYAAVFTTGVPLPADLWRGLARHAGAHIYCETNDILLANTRIVALHSLRSGQKRIALPEKCSVKDLVTGRQFAHGTNIIRFALTAPQTRVFLLRPMRQQERR